MKNFLKLVVSGLTMLVIAATAVGVRVVAFAPDAVARAGHASPELAAQPAIAAISKGGAS